MKITGYSKVRVSRAFEILMVKAMALRAEWFCISARRASLVSAFMVHAQESAYYHHPGVAIMAR
jgi:hypothetical protein